MILQSLTYDSGITFGHAINIAITGFVVVIIVLAVLAVLVKLLSMGVTAVLGKGKEVKTETPPKKTETESAKPVTAASVHSLPDNQSEGRLDLYKTDEKTAAVIMAIISKESGVPLNRLRFNSIKLVEENN